MSPLEFHPLANIFPLLEGQDFAELVADIKAHGLHEPIVVYEDKVLDGRNRLRACTAVGIEPTFTAYTGDDPVAYVVSLNLRRRHLDESQRAMVAAKLATLKLGDNQHSEGPSIEGASRLLNVGHASVERAKMVQRAGAAELVHAVEQGTVSVSAAADVAMLPQQDQREIVARGEREILRAAQEIRARKAEMRRSERIERWPQPVTNHSQATDAMPSFTPTRRGISKSTTKNPASSARPGTTIPRCRLTRFAICRFADIATDDAVLFMWTTAPHLREAFEVLAAWGFEYKTNVVWVKDKIGYFVRNQHELLLVATRGNMLSPSPANRPPSVITAPRREHSRKPDGAYELIERMYPELPKIELFARRARPGWVAWGNEPSKFGDDVKAYA
jgi:N6-adenosine-specific RNA methylase IME4/ParB-like chromosome segregation protein Spo0J